MYDADLSFKYCIFECNEASVCSQFEPRYWFYPHEIPNVTDHVTGDDGVALRLDTCIRDILSSSHGQDNGYYDRCFLRGFLSPFRKISGQYID
jgi:hypothetical protein